ncbi:MAG: thiamine phosphate synthase, partial [Proteobacteria bacterium]|nr:thiamine phosphate synthase [Pseudomonadota bacterium]
SRHLAFLAGDAGADYVAFGAFFPTKTKKAEFAAKPDLLTWWSEVAEIPCLAVGGITPQNCAPLIEAGAHFLAVSSAVWDHPGGPAEAVKAFNALMEKHSPR